MSQEPSPLVDFVAGTFGGIASLLAGHPFDTIKTRLQAQSPPSIPASNPSSTNLLASSSSPNVTTAVTQQYKSATQAFRIIVREEKVLGLFKGVTSPMLGVAVMNASVFGIYGLAIRTQTGSSLIDPSLSQIFVAGCASGALSAFITAPIDLIKIREQMNHGIGARPSTFRVIGQIWQDGGFRGIYRGLSVTSLRDLGYGSYFFTYELVNQYLISRHEASNSALSPVEMAVSGGLAGVVAWVVTFPLDTIKTQIQASTSKYPLSITETARNVYRNGGIKSFFVGVGPTIVRALPVNAVLFLVFESTKTALMSRGW